MIRCCTLMGLVLLASPLRAQARAQATAADSTSIAGWIDDLQSPRFEVREAASEALLAVGGEGEAQLLAAAASDDPEVRARISAVLQRGLLGALRAGNTAQAMQQWWPAHAAGFAAYFAGRYPRLEPACRVLAPGGEAVFGDDGGTLVWSPDPRQWGRSGRDLGDVEGWVRTLAEDEAALSLGKGRRWLLVLVERSAAAFLCRLDGRSALLAGTRLDDPAQRARLELCLLLDSHGLLKWEQAPVTDEPGALHGELAAIAGEADPAEPAIRRIYECIWYE